MNTRKIRRLRKKVENFTEFQIAETIYVFGAPYVTDWCGATLRSDTPKNALHKYWCKYARRFKELHPKFGHDCPTTSYLGKFQVTNKKTGWKDYFN